YPPRVRAAVVTRFGQEPSARHAAILRPLVNDRSLDVQTALATMLAEWPLEFASPLLLELLAEGAGPAREAALASLGQHLGFTPLFPIHGPREERLAAVRELARLQGLPATLLAAPTANSAPITDPSSMNSGVIQGSSESGVWSVAEITAELTTILKLPQDSAERADRLEMLAKSLPASLPYLTEAVLKVPPAQFAPLAKELFAPHDEAVRLVLEMNPLDVAQRRQRAAALRQLAATRTLSRVSLKLLGDFMRQEQDQQVWQEVMWAIDRDTGGDAAVIAQLAIHHRWPDIRLAGCRYVLAHPGMDRGLWLAPVIEDTNRPVRLVAVRAAGACGNPQLIDGLPVGDGSRVGALRPLLLQSTDAELTETALVALCQLRDDQAIAELLRRSQHDNPRARLRAIELIRETGNPRFVEPLIEQAWTEHADNVTSEILRTLEALVPAEDQPKIGGTTPPTRQMKVEAWAQWQAEKKQGQPDKKSSRP
ncbi:MAG: hypothetical protein C0478_14425, partial [Planctomyces sp.]|nr:hypothetical protein [Planctomyces sp.]